MLDMDQSTVLNAELCNSRDQPGRKIRRMPHNQMMIPYRLTRINLFFSKEGLLYSFHGVLIEPLAILGEDQLAPDLFKEMNSKGVFNKVELLADPGGRKPKLPCRIINVVLFRNCHKRDEIIQLHFWPTHLVHLHAALLGHPSILTVNQKAGEFHSFATKG